jgi:hypothetical protein
MMMKLINYLINKISFASFIPPDQDLPTLDLGIYHRFITLTAEQLSRLGMRDNNTYNLYYVSSLLV